MKVVPIPEGVERDDEEPTEDYGAGSAINSGATELEHVSGLEIGLAQ